jgi:hypothetical protein
MTMNSVDSATSAQLYHRPPPLGSGTAGQSLDGVGAGSLKSLARRVLQRAGQQGTPVPSRVPHGKATGTPWDTRDWRAYFDEQAGIAEHEHGCTRTVADVRAYSACVVAWCQRHPVPENDPAECRHCREDRQYTSIVPVLNGAGGHFWVHVDCLPAHIEVRRQQAIATLRTLSLEPPAGYQI